jgi:guanosine-3',5'-bis(diphosphate) 3'-pyrophosphohydrolase
MEPILKAVYDFADKAHAGQRRKYAPDPYIVHPKRVMETCRQYGATLPMLAAALLHDVLEDTDVDQTQMRDFLNQTMPADDAKRTLGLVIELTDVYIKSDYPQWNRRTRKEKELERLAATSAEAQTIKYADILDNAREIGANDPDFAPRFLRECRAILKRADKGDRALHEIATNTVQSSLDALA